MVLVGRAKLRDSKNFFRGTSFCICRISLQTQPQNQNKKYQNYSSILAIVNHRNWLDDSPPLIVEKVHLFGDIICGCFFEKNKNFFEL